MEESMFINNILRTIKKYFWIIILLAVIGGIAGKFSASNGQPPTYQTSALVLLEKQNDKTVLNINQPDDYNRFLNTAQTLMKTPIVLNTVKNELGLKDSINKLRGEVTPNVENSSQIIRINVETSNANQATKIANKTAEVFQQQIKNYLSVQSATIVEHAEFGQETQILHSRTKANITMGVIIGIVIGTLLTFFMGSLGRNKAKS
jgi:capsular polysaccharide biosynthesis protein